MCSMQRDISVFYGRSEGFPLAAYFVPGRGGRGSGQIPELFARRRRHPAWAWARAWAQAQAHKGAQIPQKPPLAQKVDVQKIRDACFPEIKDFLFKHPT